MHLDSYPYQGQDMSPYPPLRVLVSRPNHPYCIDPVLSLIRYAPTPVSIGSFTFEYSYAGQWIVSWVGVGSKIYRFSEMAIVRPEVAN